MRMDDAKAPMAGGRDGKKLEEIFDMLQLKDGKWVQVRIMPYEGIAVGQHWIDIIGSKSKKEVRIPKMCVSFDGKTEEHKKGVKCPYCAVDDKFGPFYLFNVLVRSLQEDAPRKNRLSSTEKKTGVKDPESDSWTPLKVLRVPSSLMRKIQGLKDLNKDRKTKKAYSVTDEKYGADISVMYNSKGTGTDKYQVQLADKCALTEDEMALLRFELDADATAEAMGRETPKEAAAEFKRMELVSGDKFDGSGEDSDASDDSDDSHDLGSKSKSKKSSSKSRSSRSKNSSDDSDDGDSSDDAGSDDSDDGDSSDDGKAKSKAKRSKKSSDDSDDGDSSDDAGSDDSDDSDDGDSSDDGKAKSKSSSARRKAAGSDDEDSDDAPAKSSRSKSSRSKKDSSDDAGSDDSGDDSSDDGKSKSKSSRSSKSSSSKSRSKSKKASSDSDDDIPF